MHSARFALSASLLSLLACSALGCASAASDVDDFDSVDPTATTADGLHGTNAVDTRFPTVGRVSVSAPGFTGSCSGTLVGNRTVLLAAHCVAPYAKGCPRDLMMPSLRFTISPSGDPSSSDARTYAVDDVRFHGSAYARKLAPSSCLQLDGAYSAEAGAFSQDLQSQYDLAFLRLKVNTLLPAPFKLVKPAEVLTALDNSASSAAGAVHAYVPADFRFGRLAVSTKATPFSIGFGAADTTQVFRRAGPGWFTYDDNWMSGDQIRVLRQGHWDANLRRWVYDGVSVAPGDSGGPLVVFGGTAAGQVPELPAGRAYTLGVASRGDQTRAGVTVADTVQTVSVYAPTFTTGNRFLVEWTMNDWALAERDWPQAIVSGPRRPF